MHMDEYACANRCFCPQPYVVQEPDASNRQTGELLQHTFFLALYNYHTDKVQEVFNTFSDGPGLPVSWPWDRLTDLIGGYQEGDSYFIRQGADPLHSYVLREKWSMQLARARASIRDARRLVLCFLSRRHGFSPNPLLDPDLFSYEPQFLALRPRPYTPGEAPVRLQSRRIPNGEFELRSESPLGAATRSAALHLFHPFLPLALVAIQSSLVDYTLTVSHL